MALSAKKKKELKEEHRILQFKLAAVVESYFAMVGDPDLPPMKHAIHDFQMALITTAVSHFHGNVARAAEALGMNRTTLVEKLRREGRELVMKRYIPKVGSITLNF